MKLRKLLSLALTLSLLVSVFPAVAAPETDFWGYIITSATEVLREKYRVYKAGASMNSLEAADYANAWEYISDGYGGMNDDVEAAVSRLSSNGGTATFMGMKMARKMLENLPAETDGADRKKIIIVFTDGEPGPNGYAQGDADAALAEAMKIKEDGTKIYTIGIYNSESSTVADFMNKLSSNYAEHSFETTGTELTVDMVGLSKNFGYSNKGDMYYHRNIDNSVSGISRYFYKDDNGEYWPFYIYKDNSKYSVRCLTDVGETGVSNIIGYRLVKHVPNIDPDADYYKHASDISKLSSIFETISFDMTGFTSKLSLDANAVLKDVLADGFALTDNTTVTVSVVPGSMQNGTITWGDPQQVLSFDYPNETQGSGNVVVPGAADQTQMTLTAVLSGRYPGIQPHKTPREGR